MARSFNGSTDGLLASVAAVTAYPLTCYVLSKPNDAAVNRTFLGIASSTSNLNFLHLYTSSTERLVFSFRLNSTTDREIIGSSTLSVTNYSHCLATIDSSRVPRVYINGVIDGTGTDGGAGSFSGLDKTSVGYRSRQGIDDQFFTGNIAEAAVWDRQLSGAEIALLAKGYSPLYIRNGLKFYRSLIRDLNHPGIGPVLTASGTSIVDHPPVIYPRRRMFADLGGQNQFIRPVMDVTRGSWKAVA